MNMTGNTILITGGGSGIGRALAESFTSRGNQVIIAGRRREMLEEVTRANLQIKAVTVDMNDPASLADLARQLERDFPKLNAVIHNAGIMKPEKLKGLFDLKVAEDTIATNLLGPIRLTSALLPQLLKQPHGVIMTVSSGLAFVPLTFTPTYCATKAAIHSWTQSLRYQLKDTPLKVLELIPPYVQTHLTGSHQATDPRAMPLDQFITEVMSILEKDPEATEIRVERVKPLRLAEQNHTFEQTFKGMNDAMADRF